MAKSHCNGNVILLTGLRNCTANRIGVIYRPVSVGFIAKSRAKTWTDYLPDLHALSFNQSKGQSKIKKHRTHGPA